MKKLLMGSAVLTLFSISIIIFQMSCKKDATAQTSGTNYTLPTATTSSLGGIIVGNGLSVTSSGILSAISVNSQQNKLIFKKIVGSTSEIWTANYDGTNSTKVNISLPSGVVFSDDMNPIVSPNGLKIFFTAGNVFNGDIYSSNIDGTSVLKIVDKGGANNNIILGAAY